MLNQIITLLLIALGLSMDAFAVSMTNGICTNRLAQKSKFHSMAFSWSLLFGVFQGIMPVFGYFLGKTFAALISSFDHWVAFALLVLIGGNMLWEALQSRNEPDKSPTKAISFQLMLTQAIATSIDALAVGVSFAILEINILAAACVIAVTTFVFSVIAAYLGKIFGGLLKEKAEIFGGIVLMIIGIKILLEHTIFSGAGSL